MDGPAPDGAQERSLIRHSETELALGGHTVVRAERSEPLRDRRIDAAVHEPNRLCDVLEHGDAATHELVARP